MFKYTRKQHNQHEHLDTAVSKTLNFPTLTSMEAVTRTPTLAMTNNKHCRLLNLPIELLYRIFIYAQNAALASTCKLFWGLGQSAMLRADYLMYRYGPMAALGETSMRRHIVSLPTIQQLLRLNCDPTADDYWLFIKGCELNQVDLCRRILRAGQQHLNIPHMLNLAAMKGSIDIVDLLVTEFNADIHQKAVLISACRENQVNLVKHLVATYNVSVHTENELHLRNACQRGFLKLVEFLLKDADVHAYNDAAIQSAAYKGFSNIVQLLLDAGAHADVNQNACIQHAINNNDLNTVTCLVEKGHIDPRCNHDWPLKQASTKGLNAILTFLIRKVGTADIGDGVLLELALIHDQPNTLQLLLNQGANPNCDGVARGLKYILNCKSKLKHKDEMIQHLLDFGLESNQQQQNDSSIYPLLAENKSVTSSLLSWI